LSNLEYSSSGAILTKTCTITPLEGNIQPRYYLDKDISINSTGLANLGIDFYINQKFNKPYIISIATKNLDDFKECIIKTRFKTNINALEINISCPNIDNFTENANENLEHFLTILQDFSTIPWGLKIPPFFNNKELNNFCNIIKKYPVAFIVCSNSFSNGLVLKNQIPVIAPRNGLGGIGGCYGFKSISLSNAREFKNLLSNIPIIGCGGIRNINDVLDYISVGCTAVQIGSEIDRKGLELFNNLIINI
jgi:dihydroorotate dehydrogenase (fumarate)